MFTSPKRKRDCDDSLPLRPPSKLKLDPTSSESAAEEARQPESPRGKVARQFQKLRLLGDEQGRVGRGRRGRNQDQEPAEAETNHEPDLLSTGTVSAEELSEERATGSETALDTVDNAQPPNASSEPALAVSVSQDTSPSKPHKKKKMTGSRRTEQVRDRQNPPSEPDPDDNLRLFTWQDDEITGHEMNDPDDDGEGINGIGFIPTPAMARARTEKRRQQIQEYKSREANEARRIRSERRRAAGLKKPDSGNEGESRKVRFAEAMEGEVQIQCA